MIDIERIDRTQTLTEKDRADLRAAIDKVMGDIHRMISEPAVTGDVHFDAAADLEFTRWVALDAGRTNHLLSSADKDEIARVRVDYAAAFARWVQQGVFLPIMGLGITFAGGLWAEPKLAFVLTERIAAAMSSSSAAFQLLKGTIASGKSVGYAFERDRAGNVRLDRIRLP